MNDELLSMDEIKARYADEWVLIDEFENNLRPRESNSAQV